MAGDQRSVTCAAAAALDGTLKVDLADVAARYASRLQKAEMWIRAADADGDWWDGGLWNRCLSQAALEPRFSFVGAWPRSAAFGALIVDVAGPTSPHRDQLRSDVGRLINIFVTTFDGVCDEAPDLLPQVLPVTDRVIGHFPEPWSGSLSSSDRIPRLVLQVALTTARLIRARMDDLPRSQSDQISNAIRTAYLSQLGTLARTPQEDLAARRTSLSGSAFQVSLLVGAMFVDRGRVDYQVLAEAGEALGSLFGWIDDVVDLEADMAAMQPNMVSALIQAEPGSDAESTIRRETERRWREANCALERIEYGLDGAQRELLEAAAIWLGVLDDVKAC